MKLALVIVAAVLVASAAAGKKNKKERAGIKGFFRNPYDKFFCNGRMMNTFKAAIVEAINDVQDESFTVADFGRFSMENCTYSGNLEDGDYNVELAMDMGDAYYNAPAYYLTANPDFVIPEMSGKLVTCDIATADGTPIETDMTFACMSKDQIKKFNTYQRASRNVNQESNVFKPRKHGLKLAYEVTVQAL
eukprot:m.19925 g.19925  ORF g.19925 m.19925 type:complete len:191 (+) comp8100_c0_seq1:387-959(+)